MTQEDSAAARYCRNCGHELRPEHRFCPNCGQPAHETAHVLTPETGGEVPAPPSQVGGTDQQRRQWRWSGTFERSIGVGLGGCLGIAVAIIVVVFLVSFCTARLIGGG
jgi:ribosomal protein L32